MENLSQDSYDNSGLLSVNKKTPNHPCTLLSPTLSVLSQNFTSQCDMSPRRTPRRNIAKLFFSPSIKTPSIKTKETNVNGRKPLLNITNQSPFDNPLEKVQKTQSLGYPSPSPSKYITKRELSASFENHDSADTTSENHRNSPFPESVFPLLKSPESRRAQSCNFPSAAPPALILKRALSETSVGKQVTLKRGYAVIRKDCLTELEKYASQNKKNRIRNDDYISVPSDSCFRKRVKSLPSSENAISYPQSLFGLCDSSNRDQNINNNVPPSIYSNSSPVPLISNNDKSLGESFDVSDNHCILPTCNSTRPIKHISLQTMSLLLKKLHGTNQDEDAFGENSVWLNKVKECIIIDSRYNYEYLGGHIKGAVNICFKDELHRFFKTRRHEDFSQIVIIFHCEYSKHRGPKAATALRALDRKNNAYPHLNFPEVYVLEGGYRKFFQKDQDFCTPCNFVSMFDENFQTELKKESRKYDQSWDRRGRRRLGLQRYKRLR